MRRREHSAEKIALRRRFSRWAAIVELFARGRPARKRVDPQAYVTLHRELIASCRVLAASANEVEAVSYRYLEDLAQPWLDLAVLDRADRADRDILFDLLFRCKHVQAQLGGRSWIRVLRAWGTPVFLGASFLAIMLLCMGRFSVVLSTMLDRARNWSDDLSIRVNHSTDLERLFVVGLVLIMVTIYAVSRTARS
ncbi:MAG: hypothetical protein ACXVBB_09370 [Isosphaeraceae bacterium]